MYVKCMLPCSGVCCLNDITESASSGVEYLSVFGKLFVILYISVKFCKTFVRQFLNCSEHYTG